MNWIENEFNSHFYYNELDGKIVGITHKLGTQNSIYVAKVIENEIDEKVLGQYINGTFARKAVENYWIVMGRTLLEK